MKGIWSDRWEKIQHDFYSHMSDKDDNLNVDIWSKRMVEMMFRTNILAWVGGG